MPHSKIALFIAAVLALTGCSRDMGSDTYVQSSAAGKVLKGTIISERPVKIKAHDKLQDNTAGGLAGGALGAAGGSAVGNGSGSLAAAIGGAVIGAVAGAYAEDALGTSDGMEYVVQLDAKNMRKAGPDHKKKVSERINGNVESDINSSMDLDTQTDMISVVQKADPALTEGSKVFVIYSDDRPRLAPASKTVK